MAEIIDIRAARAKRNIPIDSYFVRVDVYEDGIGGAVLDMLEDPYTQRIVSDHLFTLGRHLRDMVWKESGDDDDHQIAVVRVYASSRVNTWTSNICATEPQLEWLDERLKEAGESARP